MISWVVNGAHIIILYFVFILLPGHVGQFVCIMLATVYPIMASIVAVTTEDTAVCWTCMRQHGFTADPPSPLIFQPQALSASLVGSTWTLFDAALITIIKGAAG
jgi:hypothetical protein